MTKRPLVSVALAMVGVLALPAVALAAGTVPHVDTAPLSSFLDALNRQTQGLLPQVTLGTVGRLILTGQGALAPQALLSGVAATFAREVVEAVGLLGKLLAIGVAAAVLEQLSKAFANRQVATFAYGVAYLAVIAVAVQSFDLATGVVRGAISQMVGLMEAILPVLTTLLAGLGSISTAALFHPVVLLIVNIVAMAVNSMVVPLILLATVVELVGHLTGHKLIGLSGLLKQTGIFVLGLFLTFFVATTSIYRVAGPVADTVFLRTGKFLSLSFIPVVGKLFADATEVIFGSAYLLKQTVSIAGAIALGFIVLMPFLKLLALFAAYRLAGAALAPVGGAPIVDGLNSMATALLLLGAALLVVSLMFFLSLTLALAGGRGLLP